MVKNNEILSLNDVYSVSNSYNGVIIIVDCSYRMLAKGGKYSEQYFIDYRVGDSIKKYFNESDFKNLFKNRSVGENNAVNVVTVTLKNRDGYEHAMSISCRYCCKTNLFLVTWLVSDSCINKIQTEEFVHGILCNMPGSYFKCKNDVNWTTLEISKSILSITGYEESSFISQQIHLGELISPECFSHVWECIQTAIQDRQTFETVYKLRTAGGEFKWIWEKGSSVIERDRVVGVEGALFDITSLLDRSKS